KAAEEELEELGRFLAETGFPLKWDRERLGSFEYRALVNAWVLLKSRAPPRSPTFRKLYLEARRLAHGAEALEEAE
ncbi:MAG: tRNA-ribosyltransferase, partial [Thermoproteus sp.]|nr:tRNA-ribosyltransferase [Thermoproteus sp.]